ncbi:MAG TPA: hypothetical protein VGC34_00750, partial [Steroidobacteraceae bacterium]
MTAADQRQKLAAMRARWDQVFHAFGDLEGTPRIMEGESPADYDRRLATQHKAHSRWKDVNLYEIRDDGILDVITSQIHADALEAAKRPPTEPGVLKMRQRRDAGGRIINEFVGDIGVMLDLSRNPRQYVTGFPTLAGH